MPQYRFTSPDGRTAVMTGDSPPTEQELEQIFQQLPQSPSATSAAPQKEEPRIGPGRPIPGFMGRAVDTMANWLPMAGGVAGGLLGAGPLSIPLAALGGAGGAGFQKAIRSLRQGVPEGSSLGGDVKDLATEGAIQGASEAVGMGAGKVLSGTARQIYRRVLRPSLSERLAPRASSVVTTGLEEGVNPFSARSLGKVEPAIQKLNSEVEGIVRSPVYTPQGHLFTPLANPQGVASRVKRVGEKFEGPGAAPEDRAAVRDVIRNFMRDVTVPGHSPVPGGVVTNAGTPVTQATSHVKMLTGGDLLKARRSTGASAGASSFGLTRGAETETRKELYHHLGEEIRTLFPATRDRLAKESKLIDLKGAAQRAFDREANASPTALAFRRLIPVGAAASTYGWYHDPEKAIRNALLVELATNPRALARTAIGMQRMGSRPRVLSQIPRAGAAFWQQSEAAPPPRP